MWDEGAEPYPSMNFAGTSLENGYAIGAKSMKTETCGMDLCGCFVACVAEGSEPDALRVTATVVTG